MDAQRALELAAIRVSIDNLRSFPFVREREERGELTIHGTFFDIADGILRVLEPESGAFTPVDVFEELDAAA